MTPRQATATFISLASLEALATRAVLPIGYLGLLAGLLALGSLRRAPAWLPGLALGLAAYLGAAGAPYSGLRLGLLVGLALVAIWLVTWRAGAVLAAVSAGCSLGAVAWVLGRSPWLAEATELLALLSGAAGFVAAGLASRAAGPRARTAAAGALLILVLPLLRVVTGLPPTSPRDARLAASLDTGDLPRLEELMAAGSSEAGYAWAAAALRQNGDPELLRAYCPKRGGGSRLGEALAADVALGERACEAVRQWPEAGAASLAGEGDALLHRLAGDLLMEAGSLGPSVAAYRAASDAGDAEARADAAVALVRRGRTDLMWPGNAGPVERLFLTSGENSAEAWTTWSALHDFSDLASAARRGAWPVDAPGKTHAVYDAELGRRVLATRSRYAQGFALQLAPTPGGGVPSRLALEAKSLRGFRIYLENPTQTLVYSCDPLESSATVHVEPLPEALCGGAWQKVTLEPKQHLAEPLQRVVLRGDFRVAQITAEP